MPEYIEKMELVGAIRACKVMMNTGFPKQHMTQRDVMQIIEKFPAADVVSKAAFDQVMWERDQAMEQLQEHGIPFGGKADVVAVVCCKECLYWQSGENEGEQWEWCAFHDHSMGPHSFCSYGERRVEE